MITYLIFKLLRKYLKTNPIQAISHFLKTAAKVLLPFLLCLLMLKTIGQQSTFEYDVLRNNKVIGHTTVTGLKTAGKVTYKVSAEIKISFIKDFKAISEEETVFENGVMVSSLFRRSLNGEIKGKRSTMLIDSVYQIVEDGKKSLHKLGKIHLNISGLYLNEPLNTGRIYSDNHKQWLKITPIKMHSYRIDLPDGNHTLYHFENGICVSIDIYQTLFTARLVLVNKDQASIKIPISASY
ncbi:MAG: DUF6134 family protein [Chitinophagaceae bacterium]